MKVKNFRIEEEDWNEFVKKAQEEGSNASVELRKFIKKYNKDREYRRIFSEVFDEHKDVLDALAE